MEEEVELVVQQGAERPSNQNLFDSIISRSEEQQQAQVVARAPENAATPLVTGAPENAATPVLPQQQEGGNGNQGTPS